MNKKLKPDVVVNSVELVKASDFGVTGIKVELEAQLGRNDGNDFYDTTDCHNYLMERLAELGLAEKRDEPHRLSHDVQTRWYPIGALAYAEFYDDGSVDSEFTFTIRLDDPRNIMLLPKIVAIWNDFMEQACEDSGEEPEFDGAGMHMAFLNTSDCRYPSRFSTAHMRRFDNFTRSMTLLLPALYFLGSSDETSRPMEYREPRITMYDGGSDWSDRRGYKFSAVTYNQGALEFRVFNTCYQNPEIILDNFVVMANAVRKYWKSTYKSSGVEKVTRSTVFGNDSGHRLDRLYITTEHVDLLNEGLKRLKPSYYTIGELKQQRSFRVNKRAISGALGRIKREAITQYKEYEARFKWEQRMYQHSYMQDALQRVVRTSRDLRAVNEAEVLRQVEEEVRLRVEQSEAQKQSLDTYIAEQINRYQDGRRSNWRLEVA